MNKKMDLLIKKLSVDFHREKKIDYVANKLTEELLAEGKGTELDKSRKTPYRAKKRLN